MNKFSLEGLLLTVNGWFLLENIQTMLSFSIVLISFAIILIKLILVYDEYKMKKAKKLAELNNIKESE